MTRLPRLDVQPDAPRRRGGLHRFKPETVAKIVDWYRMHEELARRRRNAEIWYRCGVRLAEYRAEMRRQEREPAMRAAMLRRKARSAPKNAIPGWQALLGRMEPGEWYAVADMAALLPEYRRSSAKFWAHRKLRQEGWIERARNPEWLEPAESAWEAYERPVYLYRMTEKAARLRQDWRKRDRHLEVLDML